MAEQPPVNPTEPSAQTLEATGSELVQSAPVIATVLEQPTAQESHSDVLPETTDGTGGAGLAWEQPQTEESPPKPKWWKRLIEFSTDSTIWTYAWTAGLTLSVAAMVDFSLGGEPAPFISYIWLWGLAFALGALMGIGFGLFFALNKRFPGVGPWIFWPLLFSFGGWKLAADLGAWAKMTGNDRALAIQTLVLAHGGGLGLGVLFAFMQPRPGWPRGLLNQMRWWGRLPLLLILGVGAAGVTYVDRTMFPGTYPVFHTSARLVAIWLGMLGLTLIGIRFGVPKNKWLRWSRYLPAVILILLPVFTFREKFTRSIHLMLARPYSSLSLRWMRDVTDFDRDGFSPFFGGGDCAPFNSKVAPGRPEIPANGIDDNCRLGDAPKPFDRVGAQENVPVPETPAPVSILMITIDTLRPDRMSLYGHKRDTTPNLVKFSKQATKFDRAYTAGGWTSISLSAVMRGVYPRRLNWTFLNETNKFRLLRDPVGPQLKSGETVRMCYVMPVEDPLHPLPWWLQRRGVNTVAVIDDGYSQFLDRKFMGNGFNVYKELEVFLPSKKDDEGTGDVAVQTIQRDLDKDKPFFMWVHFFGPHNPSTKHQKDVPYWGDKEPDAYDHEIAFTDKQVGRILNALADKMQDTEYAVILTSDHGEKLRNATHRDHGHDLEEDSIRVPLLIKGPGFPAGQISHLPVTLVDLMPTILAMTETPAPKGLDGLDIRAFLAPGAQPPKRVMMVETWRLKQDHTPDIDLIGAYDGQYNAVYDRVNNDVSLKTQAPPGQPWQTLFGKRPPSHIEDALYQYIEETGGAINISD